MSRSAALAPIALTLGLVLSGLGCGGAKSEGVCLFTDLQSGFRARVLARDMNVKTVAPDAIDWAPDIHAAIERAKRENKPIFIASHVRRNAGDQSCEV